MIPATAPTEIGLNPQGKQQAPWFTPLADGNHARVVLGNQGAWMLVLCIRTTELGEDAERTDLRARVERDDDLLLGTLEYHLRPAFLGPDGYRYVMDAFMILAAEPEVWDGRTAKVTMEVATCPGEDLACSNADWKTVSVDVVLAKDEG